MRSRSRQEGRTDADATAAGNDAAGEQGQAIGRFGDRHRSADFLAVPSVADRLARLIEKVSGTYCFRRGASIEGAASLLSDLRGELKGVRALRRSRREWARRT